VAFGEMLKPAGRNYRSISKPVRIYQNVFFIFIVGKHKAIFFGKGVFEAKHKAFSYPRTSGRTSLPGMVYAELVIVIEEGH
jgi:hypothetical protein